MSNVVQPAPGGVQSVGRAITILEALARSGELGVTEVAGELGVHKSTVFRLMSTLEGRGLIEQTDERGKYRLGVGLLRLAGATTARLDVIQEARPICKALAASSGETVNVAVLSESSALYLDQVAGSSALQPHNWVGQHIP
ncbi:MAG: IclR family transcriptional regulator, partial [Marmoricola sp.]